MDDDVLFRDVWLGMTPSDNEWRPAPGRKVTTGPLAEEEDLDGRMLLAVLLVLCRLSLAAGLHGGLLGL
jgi:hypothetical protein